jgi:glutamine synthetase
MKGTPFFWRKEMYTESDVLDYVNEEDVKFVRLAFFDLRGVQKNISIMAGQLENAFKNGVSFDASAIYGF